jgi:ABC-2 type transport system permease protein
LESPVDLRLRPWYNPSLRYTVSMIPALVGVVMAVPAMAASLALSREREWGTLEGLFATPIGRFELILGKLIPYVLAGMLSVPLCVLTAVYLYNVDFKGNFILYLFFSFIFLFATMSIAMFLSVFIKSQQAAIMASMLVFLFAGFFMAGLLIPFALMGPLLQMEAMMLPTTHFVIISRSVIVKGAGLAELQGYVFALAAIGAIFFALTVLLFKKKI